MPSTNLIIYVVLLAGGLHSAWRGVRGLRGEVGAHYGFLFAPLVARQPSEKREQIDRKALRIGSIVRLVIGIAVACLGAYLLIAELAG